MFCDDVSDQIPVGTTCSISCDVGFEIPSETVVCLESGLFDNPADCSIIKLWHIGRLRIDAQLQLCYRLDTTLSSSVQRLHCAVCWSYSQSELTVFMSIRIFQKHVQLFTSGGDRADVTAKVRSATGQRRLQTTASDVLSGCSPNVRVCAYRRNTFIQLNLSHLHVVTLLCQSDWFAIHRRE